MLPLVKPAELAPDDERLLYTPGLGVEHPGECFRMSGDYLSFNEGTLVHGTANRLTVLPIPIAHAWVLTHDGHVYDGTLGGFFDKEDYYEAVQATEDAIYPRHLARAMMLEYETYGPWHTPWRRVAL